MTIKDSQYPNRIDVHCYNVAPDCVMAKIADLIPEYSIPVVWPAYFEATAETTFG